jgi:hypothetical protein
LFRTRTPTAYQKQQQSKLQVGQVATVPTPAELQGNFSGSANQASVASFLQANPFFQSNPSLAAQGIIDPTKIDPVAQAYIKAGLIPAFATGNDPLGRGDRGSLPMHPVLQTKSVSLAPAVPKRWGISLKTN